MSEYVECDTEIQKEEDAIEGLKLLGNSEVEIHDTAQELIGYDGSVRRDAGGNVIKANIIVRRKYVGTASNDLGLRRESNGRYTLLESQYDRNHLRDKHGFQFRNGLKQGVALSAAQREAKRQGFKINMPKKVKLGGKMKLQLTRWR
tara:strand:- start:735 stop:1175 length:441 start_codon:yes stop_codon:yes gene_type:complete